MLGRQGPRDRLRCLENSVHDLVTIGRELESVKRGGREPHERAHELVDVGGALYPTRDLVKEVRGFVVLLAQEPVVKIREERKQLLVRSLRSFVPD